MGLILLGLSLLLAWFCLRGWSDDEGMQQAALLPFADDPVVASRLERETGLHCDCLVEVPFESLRPLHRDQLDA